MPELSAAGIFRISSLCDASGFKCEREKQKRNEVSSEHTERGAWFRRNVRNQLQLPRNMMDADRSAWEWMDADRWSWNATTVAANFHFAAGS
jgi:hypothetical protein